MLQSYRRCVHALITGAGVSTPTSRRKPELGSRRETLENFAVTFASTKILVQTQWEAVRFDREAEPTKKREFPLSIRSYI